VTPSSRAERFYRGALRLLPRDFREHFGEEMAELAEARLREAGRRGSVARAREMARLVTDLTISIPREWLASRPSLYASASAPVSDERPEDNMDILLQDLRFAARGLMRRPAFAVVAAATIALGIGANTAIFSVVNAVLIRPLPYDHPDRLTLVWGTQGTQTNQGVVYADYLDWRRLNRTFADLGAFRGQSVNLTGGDAPDRLIGAFVDASFLRTINAKLERGRPFSEAETEVATKAPVAIVSHEAWVARFGSDPSLVGKQLTINGTSFTVVGITTANMPVPVFAPGPDVMVPIGYYPNAHGLDRGTRGIWVVGRLKPGITVATADRDLKAIERQLANDYPTTNANTSSEVVALKEFGVAQARPRLLLMLAAALVVLLIACANVANLQLARGASRTREMSVRAALGAGRVRMARQLLTESVVLSVVGGVIGLAVAFGLTKVLVSLIGSQLPIDRRTITVDGWVVAFALAVSFACGILFGVVPAWKASRTDLTGMLRSRIGAGLGHVSTRNALVVVQLALSLSLLASAGVLARSLMALQHVDPGFDGDRLLTAQFRLSPAKYDTPEKIWTMFDRTVHELRSLPGVESAALVRASPLSGNGETYPATIEGRGAVAASEAPQVQVNSITTDYFRTMRIPVLAGRDIAEGDRAGALPVVVVNKTFTDKTWPGQSPIGKRVKIGTDDWWTIVGIVGDARQFTLDETPLLQAYVPHAQRPQIFTSIVLRTKGDDPHSVATAVRQAVWRVDKDQPIWRFRSMREDLDAVVTSPRVMMWLVGIFSVVAVLVAVVGIYGVLSYTMSQRIQEIGIRIALGADARRVTRMVVAEGARLVGVAVAIGLVGALAATRLLSSQLFGVQPHDVVTFVGVTALLSSVALLACYIPARRASRVDAMEALRTD
jgi:predicted permease